MSPLAKRLPRELVHNLGKYLGIFLLVGLTVALCSGFLVADRSIQRTLADTISRANLQDFSFVTQFEATDEALDHVREQDDGIDVAADFYADLALVPAGRDADDDAGLTARVYGPRERIDLVTYFAGRAPEASDEVALDRNFMEENGIALGDEVSVAGRDLTVVGQVVMPDYECMMRSSSSIMFDNQTFTVAMLTQEGFDALTDGVVVYHYVCRFHDRSLSLSERTDAEEDVARSLADDGQTVTDLADRESTTSIGFVDDDLVSDGASMEILLFLIVVISAFVFVVLTDATVEQESAVIGTLLASGYRTGELVRHYLALPTLVGLAAAVVGNAVGYACLVDVMADLYYHSYALPTLQVSFDAWTFVETTVVPLVLLVAITWLGVRRKLSATPLAFLRHEVGRRTRRATAVLPERWSFERRFRTRVFLRNASHFAVLFLGIMLSSLLMLFSLALVPIVRSAAAGMASRVPARHVYTLKLPLEIDETPAQRQAAVALRELSSVEDPEHDIEAGRLAELLAQASVLADATHAYNDQANNARVVDQAEKFAVASLELELPGGETETVSVYGVEVGSDYWDDVDVSGGKIAIGAGLVDKYGLALGTPYTLANRYTDTSYVLAPTEVCGSAYDTSVYMSLATFREVFADVVDGDEGYFNGYASDEPLLLDERYVASELTPEDMSVLGTQMESSMGGIMDAMLWVAIPISVVLIYLLTKTVIDRSARSISYMKVFGYHDREIDSLYLRPVTWTVVGSYVVSIPLVLWLTKLVVRAYMRNYAGNFEVTISPVTLLQTLALGIATYLVVALVHTARVRHVSLALALKVQE